MLIVSLKNFLTRAAVDDIDVTWQHYFRLQRYAPASVVHENWVTL